VRERFCVRRGPEHRGTLTATPARTLRLRRCPWSRSRRWSGRGGGACLVRTFANVPFVRGDSDSNGSREITDAIVTLRYLFLSGPAPACLDAADADDSGSLNLTDPVYLPELPLSRRASAAATVPRGRRRPNRKTLSIARGFEGPKDGMARDQRRRRVFREPATCAFETTPVPEFREPISQDLMPRRRALLP